MAHKNHRRVNVAGSRKRIVQGPRRLDGSPGSLRDVAYQPGEARAYSRKQRYERRVERHAAQAALRTEAAEIAPVVLPPCQRHGTQPGDWWHERHTGCTGSMHLSPTVVVCCACECHTVPVGGQRCSRKV